MDWINLAQDRDKLQAYVNTVMNILVLYNGNFFTSWETVSFSRITLFCGVT